VGDKGGLEKFVCEGMFTAAVSWEVELGKVLSEEGIQRFRRGWETLRLSRDTNLDVRRTDEEYA
jgi:hypothetical protein